MNKVELLEKLKNTKSLFKEFSQFTQQFYSKITLEEIISVLETHNIISVDDSKIIVQNDKHVIETKVSKLFPNSTPQDADKITHLLKSFNKKYRLVIKSGKDCHIHFNTNENWHNENSDSGNFCLKFDCMRYKKCQDYFKLYEENPEVIKVLYIFDGDILKGHCTIFNNKYYDRIYGFDIHDFINIEKYLIENGYENIYYKKEYSSNQPKMYLQLKVSKFKYYPYMDTFKYLDLNTNRLHINDDVAVSSYSYDDSDGMLKPIKPLDKDIIEVQALRSCEGNIDHTTHIRI